jgi:hypothetical protein
MKTILAYFLTILVLGCYQAQRFLIHAAEEDVEMNIQASMLRSATQEGNYMSSFHTGMVTLF